MMRVPFCDLTAVNSFYGWALKEAYNRVMSRGQYILGPEVEAFEEEWAAYCGKRYAVGMGNCTDALTIMLSAHGVRTGDSVIVPAHTCIATWLAVSALGATPLPVDVDSNTFNLNPELVIHALESDTDNITAILGVHLYGRIADVDRLRLIADAHAVPLLFDAAQAHGIKGEHLGYAAAFSFYPTKNLGALGDGGAIVTDDEALARELRALRNLGSNRKDNHILVGGNSRLDELQAAFLRAKLPTLETVNARRARNADIYGLRHCNSVWHQCVVRSGDRDGMRTRLAQRGVSTMVHYPTAPYMQPAYRHLGYRAEDFPVASALADSVVSLPCGPELSRKKVEYVAEIVASSRVAA